MPQEFRRAAIDAQRFFESEDSPALPFWKDWTKEALKTALTDHETIVTQANRSSFGEYQAVNNLAQEMEVLAREVAKFDGFDVVLRSLAIDQQTTIETAKHWVVPVRNWLQNEDWQSVDGKLQGSHDASSLVRPEYVQAMLALGLYDGENLKEGLLDPDCIEARDWNLSSGQYKPFDFSQLKSDKSVVELISELRQTEQKIMGGLDKLLAMVEGRE